MEGPREDYGAFIERFVLTLPAHLTLHSHLPLRGLTFAVKDIFDVSGYVTGFGNPEWASTHEASRSTSPVVMALIEAGATCLGKTVMDEMAFSINGENMHYGTPTNPSSPHRVPGGSSSGSAVAVAAELVDFALGTDTGGSVRVPAAYCAILGFRPSHAVVSTTGVIPMSQCFDTVGWFARDPKILTEIGRVLLPLPIDSTVRPTSIIVPEDCFQYFSSPSDKISDILINSAEKMFGGSIVTLKNFGDYLYNEVPGLSNFINVEGRISKTRPVLAVIAKAMQLLQRFEFKSNHEKWITTTKPRLGPGIAERVATTLSLTLEDSCGCNTLRTEFQAALATVLKDHNVLAIPTVPGPPPSLGMDAKASEEYRANAFSLLSIAGMSRFCQVTIPLGFHENVPVSLSLIASHGSDHFLLNLAQLLYNPLREEASTAWRT